MLLQLIKRLIEFQFQIQIQMNTSKTYGKIFKKNIVQLFTQFGFLQKQNIIFRQTSLTVQFLCIFIFKASLLTVQFNETIHKLSNIIVDFLIHPASLIVFNMAVVIPFLLLILQSIIQKQQESRHQLSSDILNHMNLKTITIRAMILMEFILVPCLASSMRWLYSSMTDPANYFSIGLLLSMVIAFILTCISIFLNSYGILLARKTIPILLLCFGTQWNIIFVKIIAFFLVSSCLELKKDIITSINPLTTAFKFLLVFIFALDAFTPSIGNAFFFIFVFIITLMPFASPEQQSIEDNIDINEFFLKVLDNMKNKKQLKVIDRYKIIKEVITYQDSVGSKDKNQIIRKQFKLKNPITYENLCQFFRMKIDEDMLCFKQEQTYKLQHFLFEIKHNNIPFEVLKEITLFSEQTKKNFDFAPKIRLLEVQHEIDKVFKKRDEIFNLQRIISMCTKIQLTNKHLNSTLNLIINFWRKLNNKELTFIQVCDTMNKIQLKEEFITETIRYLEQYPTLGTQNKLYKYALQLSNFSYDQQDNTRTALSSYNIASTYFVIMRQYKVIDVSNQMMMELHKKKSEVLEKSLSTLIPQEIVSSIEEDFIKAFKSNEPEKKTIPLLNIKNRLTSFRVDLQITFSLESGVQQVIHFVKSDDLHELPTFLYCPNSDKILYINEILFSFMKNMNQKIDQNIMGFDLFGSDLSLLSSKKQRKINDVMMCTLTRNKQTLSEQQINLKILDIFKGQSETYMLISFQDSEKVSELTENTIFLMDNFIKSKSLEQKGNSSNKINKENKKIINEEYFCPIPNPYQSQINESMNKLKIPCRTTLVNIIGFLMVLFALLIIGSIVYNIIATKEINSRAQSIFTKSIKKANSIQNSYEIFYLYYRYYQIKNYPEQIMRIQNYNMTYLNAEYLNLTNSNITAVLHANIKNFAMNSLNYTIKHKYFNQTKTTNQISLIDFLTDIKQALYSNNPQFTIRNQHNLETIVSAYESENFNQLNSKISTYLYIVIGTIFLQLVVAITIKCLSMKLKKMEENVMELYETMTKDVIREQFKKYKELKAVTQYSDSKLENFNKELQFNFQGSQEKLNKVSRPRIKKKSFVSQLISNNFIIFITLSSLFLVVWLNFLFINYQNNIELTFKKSLYLQDTQVMITKPALKFYQKAMEEFLPPGEITPELSAPFENISTNHIKYNLPNYFQDYQILESTMLQKNLCQYAYLNQNQIYRGINCSFIIDGIMQKAYSQVYSQYIALVRNYTGVKMSKLGETYRMGAVYPVFLEIIYIRRNLNVIFTKLKTDFEAKIPGFLQNEYIIVQSILLNEIYIIPVLFIMLIFQFRRFRNESRATIRAFKMIPKDYLLKMKVTKQIKNEQLLAKMEMF